MQAGKDTQGTAVMPVETRCPVRHYSRLASPPAMR